MSGQRGVALIVSLVVLVVAALLGLSSFQASQLEERMAGNHRFSVSALQGAEVGVNEMLGAVLSFTYTPGNEFCNNLTTSLSGSGFSIDSDGIGYSNTEEDLGGDLDVRYKAYMTCDGDGHVIGYSRGVVLGSDGEDLSARRVRVEIIPPGYDSVNSMLGNQITVPGNSTIIGDVHSNTSIDISLQATGKKEDRVVSQGNITSTGDMTIGGNDAPPEDGECSDVMCAVSGVPERLIPSAQELIDEAKALYLSSLISDYSGSASDATNPDNPPIYDPVLRPVEEGGAELEVVDSDYLKILDHDESGNCTVDDPGVEFSPLGVDELDDNGEPLPGRGSKIYYCPGTLTVNGDFGGVTVMSEGDFIHKGAATISDDSESPIDTFVVSGGKIELRGVTEGGSNDEDTYAAFLSEGDFVQNGTSKIYGTIVSNGAITSNGGIDFEARDTGKIIVPVSGRLEGWVELEDPSDEENLTI